MDLLGNRVLPVAHAENIIFPEYVVNDYANTYIIIYLSLFTNVWLYKSYLTHYILHCPSAILIISIF